MTQQNYPRWIPKCNSRPLWLLPYLDQAGDKFVDHHYLSIRALFSKDQRSISSAIITIHLHSLGFKVIITSGFGKFYFKRCFYQ